MTDRIRISEDRAKELADEAAKRIYEVQEKTRKDEEEGIKRALDPLGLDPYMHGPAIPEIEDTEEETAQHLKDWLEYGDSERYVVEGTDEANLEEDQDP